MCDTVYMPVHTQRICGNITGPIGMASRRILLSRRQQLSRISHGRMRLRWIPRQHWWNPARLSNRFYDDRRRVCCRNKKRNIFIFWWMEYHPNMPCGGWYWHGNTRHKIYLRKRNKPGQRNCNRNLVWLQWYGYRLATCWRRVFNTLRKKIRRICMQRPYIFNILRIPNDGPRNRAIYNIYPRFYVRNIRSLCLWSNNTKRITNHLFLRGWILSEKRHNMYGVSHRRHSWRRQGIRHIWPV